VSQGAPGTDPFAGRPEAAVAFARDVRRRSFAAFWLLCFALLGCAIAVRLLPAGPGGGSFRWLPVLAVIPLGLVGTILQPFAGVPPALTPEISNRWRWLFPALAGAAFGLVALGPVAAGPAADSFGPFPVSLVVLFGDAILVELLLRVVALTIPAAVLGLILARRWRAGAF
jgi:hypothetical protein